MWFRKSDPASTSKMDAELVCGTANNSSPNSNVQLKRFIRYSSSVARFLRIVKESISIVLTSLKLSMNRMRSEAEVAVAGPDTRSD